MEPHSLESPVLVGVSRSQSPKQLPDSATSKLRKLEQRRGGMSSGVNSTYHVFTVCVRRILPDGDDLSLTPLDVPAAVDSRGVVQRPGGAVDDPPPLCVDLHPLTAACWRNRRHRERGTHTSVRSVYIIL